MNHICKHDNKLLIIISTILVIPFIFNVGLLYDDPFSMGMINHTYPEIIKLTALDVHPPLYYFVLKAFLSITTFWTTNIFVKIFLARILSLIFTFVSLTYIMKIFKVLNISFNKYLTTLFFIALPVTFGLDPQATHIRMYSMCTAMTIIVIYYLIMFIKTNQLRHLSLVSIFSALSLYTNYYFGLIAGLYILSAIFYELHQKKYSSLFKLISAGIISLILFIPWIHNLILQINVSNSNSVQTPTSASKNTIIKYIVFIMIIIISFAFKKNVSKKVLYLSYSSIAISIIIFVLNVIMYTVSVSLRYTSTPLILLILLSVILKDKENNKRINISNIVKIAMILLVSFTFAKSLFDEITQFNIPSIRFIKTFNKIKNSNNTEINSNDYGMNSFVWKNQGGNAIYLLSINKNISDKHYTNVYYSVGNGNTQLFHSIFPNIEHYYSK